MVEGARLEIVYAAMYRRFESSRFRHTKRNPFRDLFLYAWWDIIDVRRYENRRNRIKSRACSNFFEVTPDFIDLLRKSIILSLPFFCLMIL